MEKPTSLIHKTLVQFLVCTAVIFLLMAPVFYLLTKHFYAEDMIDLIESVRSGHGIPELDLERDIMEGVMLQFMLIFATLSIAMFVTIRFITRRLWHPFDDTLSKTEDFNLARRDMPEFRYTDITEFNRLNDSLYRLINRDRRAYLIQKEFTENASHELQTPLAVTRCKLDLLLQEDLSERQSELVSELYSLNTRMGHLNRNLLLLAKIDNDQYDLRETIALPPFIESLLPSYNQLKGSCSVTFECHSADRPQIKANPILLECLLNNLIVNAIRHTADGSITVSLTDRNTLTVSNPGTKTLNPDDIFRRFKSGNAPTEGTGLGLAIVKAICDYHGWTIAYRFDSHFHRFTISLREL